jgi:hypothetical protein
MKKKTKKEKKQDSNPEESIEISSEFITTVPQLKNFIKKIPKCHTISSRLTATKNLLEIKTKELYQKFIELKGLSILSNWLKEYKKSVASGTDLTLDEECINTNIINLCQRIHLSKNDLKNSKIGKNINSLGKALPEGSDLRKKCEDIITKWKQMLENDEEKEEENNPQPEQFQINNASEGTNNYAGNINNNNFLNNKTRRNNFNTNMLSNINTNANNINLNANNLANKINPIKIKTYVKNSTNFFFSLLSKIKKCYFSL